MRFACKVVSKLNPAQSLVVAVLGAGRMGAGIARALCAVGLEVRLHDVTTAALDQARRGSPAGVELPALHADLVEAVTGADLVLESVAEDRATKESVLSTAAAHTGPDVPLGTNTSSLDVVALGVAIGAPDRVLGVHWFNPPDVVPGVEVAPSDRTAPEVVERVVSVLRRARKTPVVVRCTPGYVANRLHEALMAEAIRCVADGTATPEQVDAVVCSTFGPRLAVCGPFEVIDQTGLDVQREALRNLARLVDSPAFDVPPFLDQLIAAGRTGLTAGAGVYVYDESAEAVLADRTARMVDVLAAAGAAEQERRG